VVRRPLFPGKDFVEQLQLISDVLGKPTPHEINFFESAKAREFLRALPEKKGVPLSSLFSSILDEHGLDLLSKLLVFDPRKRITAEEALRHRFFAPLFNAESVVPAPTIGEVQKSFSFELNGPLDLSVLRELILQEVREIVTGVPCQESDHALQKHLQKREDERRQKVDNRSSEKTQACGESRSSDKTQNSSEGRFSPFFCSSRPSSQNLFSFYPASAKQSNLPPLPRSAMMEVDRATTQSRPSRFVKTIFGITTTTHNSALSLARDLARDDSESENEVSAMSVSSPTSAE
jgi:serine/threonine protein kinase